MVTSTDAQVSRSLRYDGRHEVEDLLRESFRRMQLVDVHAQVNAEELILSGTAFSWYEKQLAQELARSSARGFRIRNQINVHSLLN